MDEASPPTSRALMTERSQKCFILITLAVMTSVVFLLFKTSQLLIIFNLIVNSEVKINFIDPLGGNIINVGDNKL